MTVLRALAAALLVVTQAQQRDAPPPPSVGSATVRGRVVIAGTTTPVPRAIVSLGGTREHPARPRTIYTNASGAFEFAGVAPGAYSVGARPNRYQLQLLPSSGVTPANAVDGQITDIEVALPRAAAIVGRVVDELGQPMGRVLLMAQRVGDRPESSGYSGNSDEYGRYRVFNLPPGRYYILARPDRTNTDFGVSDPVGFLESYFPGTVSRDEAVRVPVRAGEEVDAGDLRLVRGRMLRVRGIVVDSQGKAPPPGRSMVSLSTAGGSEGRGPDAEGRFEFGQRVAGTYQLSATVRPESGAGVDEYASQRLTLTDADVDLVVTLTPSARVSGRVVIEDADQTLAAGLSVRAAFPSERGYLGPESTSLRPDQTFTFNRLAGERLLRLEGAGMNRLVLKAVMRGNEDVTNLPTVFGPEDAIRIVLSPRSSRVEGLVTIEGTKPAAGIDVIVFSEDQRTWVRDSTGVQRARTDPRGRYRTPPVPPGRYYIVAVTPDRGLAPYDVDPTVLEGLIRDATMVVVNADENRGVDLRLTNPGGY